MISYSRDPSQEIPTTAVKIVGLGGAGANMLERIALDSIEGAQLLALNTDIRTLGASLAKEKIQLGVNLTKGLGTGGDPELGNQAVLEAEKQVREALKGQKIVFLCTGLGGGTGSGAAPIVARIAREEGAFVAVFATMPFFFEGRRRRDQAETALNQLAVLSNALVTFDNNRMGELVLAKQGIHEAFGSADKMISESIKAVIRLVVRPGLINIGLDDLMTALRTTRSRCLFGSGIAEGKDRASKALRNALSSPLLDQGALLKDAQSVLVHLSGGESLTLFEIELLMQNLQKHVPEDALVLFGAAIDPSMGDSLSITLISALPEDALTSRPPSPGNKLGGDDSPFEEIEPPRPPIDYEEETKEPVPQEHEESADTASVEEPNVEPAEQEKVAEKAELEETKTTSASETESPQEPKKDLVSNQIQTPQSEAENSKQDSATVDSSTSNESEESVGLELEEKAKLVSEQEERPYAEPELLKVEETESKSEAEGVTAPDPDEAESDDPSDEETTKESDNTSSQNSPELKLDSKTSGPQSELEFSNAPRGRFEGEEPSKIDGEDLDLPPFLRKKKQ